MYRHVLDWEHCRHAVYRTVDRRHAPTAVHACDQLAESPWLINPINRWDGTSAAGTLQLNLRNSRILIQEILHWLYQTPWANTVRTGHNVFPLIESIHVVAFATVVGSILYVDLRLIGLTSRARPLSALAHEVLPLTWGAFGLTVLSGAALFSANAPIYFENPAFRLKMLLILLAGINMLIFHTITYRSIRQWDCTLPPPWAGRLAGVISIVLWIGSITCGRLIGFTVE